MKALIEGLLYIVILSFAFALSMLPVVAAAYIFKWVLGL